MKPLVIMIYKWIEKLEFDLLKLPKCDIGVFLHMPTKEANLLKKNRTILDQLEKDANHLNNAENAYQEIATKYNFYKIECVRNNKIRTIEEISDELNNYVISQLKICHNNKKVL